MPELPEVEVTKLGISPYLTNQTISAIRVHQTQLRWPIPDAIQNAVGQVISSIERRAKYLFLRTQAGYIVIHLGMSGKLCVINSGESLQKHDHVEIELASGKVLRLNDPRRFGAVLFLETEQQMDELLANSGPEPLTEQFTPEYLFELSRNRSVPIKQFIMDNKVVVGVGNIYANESLFMTGIHPKRPAKLISLVRYTALVEHIKTVLARAITQGGTTLKDFSQADGKPGYFAQELLVYGKKGKPCPVCKQPIATAIIAQRNSFYCKQCQT